MQIEGCSKTAQSPLLRKLSVHSVVVGRVLAKCLFVVEEFPCFGSIAVTPPLSLPALFIAISVEKFFGDGHRRMLALDSQGFRRPCRVLSNPLESALQKVGGTDLKRWVAPISKGGWHRSQKVGGTDLERWVAPISKGGWHRLWGGGARLVEWLAFPFWTARTYSVHASSF